MYRRVVVYTPSSTTGDIKILYRVYGGILLSQQRFGTTIYNAGWDATPALSGVRFVGSYMLKTTASLAANRPYEFIMDVRENQPGKESISEITAQGVYIAVYNENGVVVCDNGKRDTIPAETLTVSESFTLNSTNEEVTIKETVNSSDVIEVEKERM